MGHQVSYNVYEVTESKQYILSCSNEEAIYNGDYHHELYGGINFMDNKVFESYEEAQEWIESHHSGYDNVAVKFKDHERPKEEKLKKYNELRDKAQEAYNNYYKLNRACYLETITSQFVGCSNCGSKLNREITLKRYRSNKCPICTTDLRPKTTLDRVAKAEEKWNIAKAKQDEEYKKQQAKTPLKEKWLVKIEYHV